MTEVFTTLGGGIHGSRDGLGSADDRRMKRARDYLESHLFDPVTLPDLARKMAMRVSPLQRTFREGMGLSVFENIRQRRLGIAREDLIRGRTSITEVAFRCGYGSSANFATAFKRQFGQSPSAVRRHGSA
jgi:AraC-like DNA-binding protein